VTTAVSLVVLAVAAPGQSPGPGLNRPSQTQVQTPSDPIVALSRNIESLQAQVNQLQAQVKRLESHTHSYGHAITPVNYWMSIGQLRAAMEPHSNTDINVNWIPIQVAERIPQLSRALMSETGPPRGN
jgi:hypothetical protein